VLDEPTVGLDVDSRRGFMREIRRFTGSGCAMLLTTHYLEEAEALADRVVVLQQGRIIADGRLDEITRRASSVEIRCVTQLDDETLNAIPGVSRVRRDRTAVVLTVAAAEPAARELLLRDHTLSDLAVTRATLEDAFVALTTASAADVVGIQ
jgi:ABC-2 type transport system ATP-binding protein